MEKIIINVDDFGLSRAYNLGIIEAYQAGVISSTTLLVTSEKVDHAVNLAHENPGLGVGLHLALSSFKSLTNHSEISINGRLKHRDDYVKNNGEMDQNAIYAELKAQLLLFIEKMGKKPTHLDMHHHLHRYSNIKEVVIKLANEYDLSLRNEETVNGKSIVNIDFYAPNINQKQLEKSISELLEYDKAFNRELCVHAGYIDQYIMENSSYNLPRIEEQAVLMNQNFKDYLNKKEIELVTY